MFTGEYYTLEWYVIFSFSMFHKSSLGLLRKTLAIWKVSSISVKSEFSRKRDKEYFKEWNEFSSPIVEQIREWKGWLPNINMDGSKIEVTPMIIM